MLIPKANEERDNYPCWRGIVDGDGNYLKPIVYCKCGQPCGINGHSIDENGKVTPSILHQKKAVCELEPNEVNGCDFHEYIELEGYSYGAMK